MAHFGSAPASVDGVVSEPAFTLLNVGARYRSTLWGAPATLRVQALNLTNTYVWNVFFSPGFYQFLHGHFLLTSPWTYECLVLPTRLEASQVR